MKAKIRVTCLIGVTVFLLLCTIYPLHASNGFAENHDDVRKKTFTDAFDIVLDCSKTNGRIRPYAEINCGPLPNHYVKEGVDLSSQYQEIGVDFIRTHDFSGPTDVSRIFPNWSADPLEESSYDFNVSDQYITAIVNTGCQVFYRLGESASDNETLRQPPQDFSKWAEICKHIVMHYNDGWANGYHYNITYWEVWNEPDLKGFWDGTTEQYYQLYNITAKTLKNYNSSLKVGGPCTSSVFNVNYTIGFLNYVKENNVPLDFFSWHMYTDNPHDLYAASCYIRTLLDTYGFSDCENINTEWNINILTPQRDKDNAKNAAFTACSLTAFQDAYLDHAFRYRGTQDNSWFMRFIGFDLSLFTYEGMYKTPALVYLAMHYLTQDTPIRLVTPEMDASSGITYLAGISEDKTNVSILLSNYDSFDTTYTLNVVNLPWNTTYTIVHYLIDDNHHLQITEKTSLPSYTITQTLRSNTVHFIRLTNSTVTPNEGPNVASIPLLLHIPLLDPITRLLGILILMLIFG